MIEGHKNDGEWQRSLCAMVNDKQFKINDFELYTYIMKCLFKLHLINFIAAAYLVYISK